MKRTLHSILLLPIVFGCVGVFEAKSQGILREVLNRMDKHYKNLQTLQANVDRSMMNFQLDEASDYAGTLTLVPGSGKEFSMRLDWTKPSSESISVLDGKYEMYNPRTKILYYGAADKVRTDSRTSGNPLSVLNMNQAQMRAAYDPSLISDGAKLKDGTLTFHVKLLPKTRQSFKQAELWVDSNGMPRQIKVTAHNNDTDMFFLSNPKKNETVDLRKLRISAPDAKRMPV